MMVWCCQSNKGSNNVLYDYTVEMTTKDDICEQYKTVITFNAQKMSDSEAFTKAVNEAKSGAFFHYQKNMWNLNKVTKVLSE